MDDGIPYAVCALSDDVDDTYFRTDITFQTEELAELYLTIKAIEYERGLK
jgi:hypothetical protein